MLAALVDHDRLFAARRYLAMDVIHLSRGGDGAPYEWTPARDPQRAEVQRVVSKPFAFAGRRPPPHPEVTRDELHQPPLRWTPGMAQRETESEPP